MSWLQIDADVQWRTSCSDSDLSPFKFCFMHNPPATSDRCDIGQYVNNVFYFVIIRDFNNSMYYMLQCMEM
jgi:hypothetical protein